ncbi:MAG: L,D-transpeptidase family protein [Pseudomonadota bacterium]|nr:L,D-transpeptidase family protein [Pseudomonadota bacterium]
MPIRQLCLFILDFVFYLALNQPLYAATFAPDGDVIGSITHYAVRKKDNLYGIARRFDLGIVEVLAANPGVDPWQPEEGTELTLPTTHILPPVHEGIVLNLSELRLFYFAGNGTVMTFPIGIGREGWQTPIGSTTVVLKRKNPAWIPPDSIREENPNLPDIVPPGPDNPLGRYALNLDMPGIRIHGTNRPYGIGKRSSHGCIRLYPEDIERLFNAVDAGTPVTILDNPYKLGWRGNTLLLEVTPTQEQDDIIAEYRIPHPVSLPEIYDAIRQIAGNVTIDWHTVDQTVAAHAGIPVIISRISR